MPAQAFQRHLAKHGKHMAALLPLASMAMVGGGAEEMYGTLAKCLDVSCHGRATMVVCISSMDQYAGPMMCLSAQMCGA
eukprot:352152-Chlamydomonas_euryale.AAC.3